MAGIRHLSVDVPRGGCEAGFVAANTRTAKRGMGDVETKNTAFVAATRPAVRHRADEAAATVRAFGFPVAARRAFGKPNGITARGKNLIGSIF